MKRIRVYLSLCLGGFGYSCITSVDEQHIGLLYESSQADVVFRRIDINELLNRLLAAK